VRWSDDGSGSSFACASASSKQRTTRITALNADLQRRVDAATAELRGNLERLTELDRLKSQFMSIASHELKTPVTAMSGFCRSRSADAQAPRRRRPSRRRLAGGAEGDRRAA